MEFSHPCFQRDNPYLLEHIKRKISTAKTSANDDKSLLKTEIVSKVLTEVKQVKGRQDSLDSRFVSMKQENEALWREVAILRQKHMKQQQIVNKLIQFLVTIVQPQRGSGIGSMGGMGGVKRRFQLMINDVPEAKARKTARRSSASSTGGGGGPIIRELTEELLDYEDPDDDTMPSSPYIMSPGFEKHDVSELDEIEDVDEGNMIYNDDTDLLDENGDVIYDNETNEIPTTTINAVNTDAGPSTSDTNSSTYTATNTLDPSAINYVIENIESLVPQAANIKSPATPQYQIRQQPANSNTATKIKILPARDAKIGGTKVSQKQSQTVPRTSKQIPLATVTSGGKSLLNTQIRGIGSGGKQLPNATPQTATPNLPASLMGKRIVSNATTTFSNTSAVAVAPATITSAAPTSSSASGTQKKAYTNKDDFISTEIPTDLFGDAEQVNR